jgi:hypothetical protein
MINIYYIVICMAMCNYDCIYKVLRNSLLLKQERTVIYLFYLKGGGSIIIPLHKYYCNLDKYYKN